MTEDGTLHPVQFEFGTVIEWEKWKLECIPNLRYAASLEMPHLPQLEPHTGKCAIVGAGPSVEHELDQIKAIQASDLNCVMSLNGAHAWLIKNGIKPSIHVIFEPDIEDVRDALGGDPQGGVAYYIASQSAPKIFEQLEGYHRVLWHAYAPPMDYQQAVADYFPGEFMVVGGYATFFRTLTIATILGFRDFELFGIDSSFEASSHVQGYVIADIEPRINVWGTDPRTNRFKKFTTQGGLAFQAKEFLNFCKANQAGLKVRAHGNGLLRYLHEARYPEQYMKGT